MMQLALPGERASFGGPLVTPFHVPRLLACISSSMSPFSVFLISGFTKGFSIGMDPAHRHLLKCTPSKCYLLPKTAVNLEAILAIILDDIQLGRVAGPFTSRPRLLHISPVGLVAKSLGRWRMIQHFSFPEGSSVNDGISDLHATVEFIHFDVARDLILQAGHGAFLAKLDIVAAFRCLPVCTEDQPLLGFAVAGYFFFHRVISFGLRSGSQMFERFSCFLQLVLRRRFPRLLITHFLDDFLIIGRSSSECQAMFDAFLHFCHFLGVPIASGEKRVAPTPVLTFLGLEIDVPANVLRLPVDKVTKLRTRLEAALAGNIDRKQLEKLIGLCAFAAKALPWGRPFLRSGFAKLAATRHRFHVSGELRRDLQFWLLLLRQVPSSLAVLVEPWTPLHRVGLVTDAALWHGFGGHFGTRFFYGEWDSRFTSLQLGRNIAFLELVPVVIGVALFGPELTHRRLIIRSDNMAVVEALNRLGARDVAMVALLRQLALLCCRYDVHLRATHLPGWRNSQADALSRGNIAAFLRESPGAQRLIVPAALLDRIVFECCIRRISAEM